MHEQIENECIIGLLQQRSSTVYNVHGDNKLSDMLSLFEKGLRNVKVQRNVVVAVVPETCHLSPASLDVIVTQLLPVPIRFV